VVVVGTYNWEDDFAGVVDGYAEGFEDFDLGVVAGGISLAGVSARGYFQTEHIPITTTISFSHPVIIAWTGRWRLSPCSVAFFPADRSLVVRTLLRPRRS